MMRYKTKFNLLRDEVVKANNELVDNKVFETYVNEDKDTIMITNRIVKALVKTIKFYEQENSEAKGQVWLKDAKQTCNRMPSYITKLERENEEFKNELEEAKEKLESLRKENKGWESYIKELKEQNECYKTDNENLIETAERLNKRNDALENEISEISDLFNEKVDTIIKRDNEIDALKHMLDREER